MKSRNREVARYAGVDYDSDSFRDLLDGESRKKNIRRVILPWIACLGGSAGLVYVMKRLYDLGRPLGNVDYCDDIPGGRIIVYASGAACLIGYSAMNYITWREDRLIKRREKIINTGRINRLVDKYGPRVLERSWVKRTIEKHDCRLDAY